MLPGSGIFTAAVKRGVAPHTRKQRVLAAISKLRSAFFTGYMNKIARTIIGERAKRARHSHVCSIENRGYIYIYILEKWFPLWGERAHSLKLFCMYDKRFEI